MIITFLFSILFCWKHYGRHLLPNNSLFCFKSILAFLSHSPKVISFRSRITLFKLSKEDILRFHFFPPQEECFKARFDVYLQPSRVLHVIALSHQNTNNNFIARKYFGPNIWSATIIARLIFSDNNKVMDQGVPPQLSGFVCTYHYAASGSNPKHTIYTFLVKLCTILSLCLEKDNNKQKRGRNWPI